jgi:hypothetical protein
MSELILTVRCQLGALVEQAADELCALADRVGVVCEMDFNGIRLRAFPDESRGAELLRAYYAALDLQRAKQ